MPIRLTMNAKQRNGPVSSPFSMKRAKRIHGCASDIIWILEFGKKMLRF